MGTFKILPASNIWENVDLNTLEIIIVRSPPFIYLLSFKKYLFYLCVYLCECMCICGCSIHRGQKRAMDHPEIGVMLPEWMLGTELKPSARETRAVNHLSCCSKPIFTFPVMWFVY